MKKLYIPIIVFLGISMVAISQEKSSQELKGDKYAFSYSYNKAIDSYKQADKLTLDGQRKLAQSYCKMNNTAEAEIVYAKLVSEPQGVLPEDYYNYAMVLKANGKYEEAGICMDKFVNLAPNDLRGKDYLAHKSELPILLKDNGKYKLTHLNINTNAEDFGTCYYKNSIVFSSTRSKSKLFKKKYNLNGKPFLNMYVSEVDGSELKEPTIFDKKLDGKMHDGPASFNKEGTFIAFTRNHYHDKSKDKVIELQIYLSTYKDGSWSKAEPFVFNNNDYSVGHPCLSADGNTMYFVSNMPGGFGGTDIYKTSKNEKGEWLKPENLGNTINTEGDEMFPFLASGDKTFYFSSNGRFGLGGQDIFMSTINGSNYEKTYNAGAPLNTKFDDFAVIEDTKTHKGYFSSNRSGGSGDDDIYTVEFLQTPEVKKILKGIAKDKNDKQLSTGSLGTYSFSIDSNKNFNLIGTKKNYTDGKNVASSFTKDLIIFSDVVLLTKEEVIDQKVEVETDLGKIAELSPIYFDLDKYSIRSDAEIELHKIIKIMNKYPSMVVELSAHTDCRETYAYNQILSDKRANSTVNYIRKYIIKPERITGKGYGKTKLLNGCSCDGLVLSTCSEEEHQKNRRTEFIIKK
jgi:outer membrane protein OmpA-like peptidoglycan-associated protein